MIRPIRGELAPTALALTSYGTSFIRDQFLFWQVFGSAHLDMAFLFLAGSAVLANTVGAWLTGLWVGGLIRASRIYGVALMAAGVGVTLTPAVPLIGLGLCFAACSLVFDLSRNRAASVGNQNFALIGAIVAPVPSVIVWVIVGTATAPSILLGWVAGCAFQGAIATYAGRGAQGLRQNGHVGELAGVAARHRRGPLLLALVFQQANAMLDRYLFASFPPGTVAAGVFAYNVADSVVLVSASPAAAQLLAGGRERHLRRVVQSLACVGALCAAFSSLWIAAFVVQEDPSGRSRLQLFIVLYCLGAPSAATWAFAFRSGYQRAEEWALWSKVALAGLFLHVVVGFIGAALGFAWLVVLGWVLGAILMGWTSRRWGSEARRV